LSILLGAIFFFSAHVFAVSAVLGVDLGTEYIKAALVKPGIPLEIVLTKDSRRKEISAVVFKPSPNGAKKGAYPERVYGSDAMALAPRFPGDAFPNLKPLLGLPADSDEVKEYVARHPALQLEAHKLRNTAAFKSATAFTPEEEAWLVEELLAMELQSIKRNAEELAGSSVSAVVLTVPPFYTIEEKRATEMAAELAGLKVLSLISDGLAVGLNYATSRTFPNVNEGGKPEYHMIFDMGAGSTKATVLKFQSRTVKDVGKFNKTVQEIQVLGTGWDRTLGGDALNYLIVDDMIEQFVALPNAQKASIAAASVRAHGRAIAKLTKEAERVRHVLSANQNTQASFEGLYDDVDFKYKITRADFEEKAATHAKRVSAAIQDALHKAGLEMKDLDSVILHGGASRTPFVQKELEQILGSGDKIRTNVNSDESAVFGAGFRAAELSPSFRVKEIRVSEGAAYPAGMRWKNDEGKDKHQRLWTATSHLGAAAKEVTLPNREDFTANFYQLIADSVEANTKTFTTTNLTATVAELVEKHKCEKTDIHFKVGVRLAPENGEVEVTKATVECEAEEQEKEGIMDGVKNLFGFGKKDQQPIKDGESSEEADGSSSSTTTESSNTSASASSSASSAAASESAEPKTPGKKQLVVIPVKFTLEKAGIPQLPKADLTSIKNRLKAFDNSDKERRAREEALNQLEAYTYRVRELIETDDFIAYSTEQERSTIETKASEASDWLYEDGVNAPRDDFKKKLKELKGLAAPIEKRIEEGGKRPELLKELQEALKTTKDFVEEQKVKIKEYEAFQEAQASASAAFSSAQTVSTEETSSEATPAASPSDNSDGLEDGEASSSSDVPAKVTEEAKPRTMEDINKVRGPVPPLYTLDDLKESEELFISISTWLETKVVEQDKLGPTDDPVLLVKELTERRQKLDKAGVDLAMKGVRNFEKKGGNKKTKSSTKAKDGKKATKSGEKKPESTIKIGEDGKMPTEEELNEMIKKLMAEQEEKARQEKAQEEAKQEGSKEEMKEGHDEL